MGVGWEGVQGRRETPVCDRKISREIAGEFQVPLRSARFRKFGRELPGYAVASLRRAFFQRFVLLTKSHCRRKKRGGAEWKIQSRKKFPTIVIGSASHLNAQQNLTVKCGFYRKEMDHHNPDLPDASENRNIALVHTGEKGKPEDGVVARPPGTLERIEFQPKYYF
ncbi:hypothetical protein K438DRAFT_1759095 [Mycena galopus ATCC 62051]|nr:hypothetical protein K438DRAFT_1789680 [Mycena galopus ATCC 62051]KAF8200079.1 hypothetical protein K438DRAFT_1759095 [Mycena galopus ATCC 62051]